MNARRRKAKGSAGVSPACSHGRCPEVPTCPKPKEEYYYGDEHEHRKTYIYREGYYIEPPEKKKEGDKSV